MLNTILKTFSDNFTCFQGRDSYFCYYSLIHIEGLGMPILKMTKTGPCNFELREPIDG